MKRVVIIGIIMVLMAGSALADSFTGTVVRVIDGDTVSVSLRAKPKSSTKDGESCQKKFHKVRLAEIDAPEKKQVFGAESTKALSDKVLGKTVVVEWSNKGRYGRIIGTVYLDERNINQDMIRDGFAWWYRKYSKDNNLSELETNARQRNRGLWTAKHPIPPWQYRKR